MRQALHIFGKDVRSLRLEILLLLVLAATLGWTELHLHAFAVLSELLMILVVNYTIARVIHAEAIPGHNQFWITRPYRWSSLLSAKILFILVFVNLPIFAAQCYMIVSANFSFATHIAGLLWSQLLMIVCVSLPVACIASLTAGLMPFLLAEFIAVAAAFILDEGLHVRARPSAFLPALQTGPDAVSWVRDTLAMVIVICVAAFVLYWQYRTRRTDLGNKYAIGGAVLAAIVFACMPWPFALTVQQMLSKQTIDRSSMSVGLGSVKNSVFSAPDRAGHRDPYEISLPFLVKRANAGADQELQADSLYVDIVAANGRTWSSGSVAPVVEDAEPSSDPSETVVAEILHLDPAFFAATRTSPVTVQARFYLTLFGDTESMTIPIRPEPVNIMDGMQCAAGFFNQLGCASLFRWPRRRVYAKTGDGGVESHIRTLSYSPFPATLGFIPVEQHSFTGAASSTQATITTKAPISYFDIDARIPGVSLTDYTADAKRQALTAPPPPGAR